MYITFSVSHLDVQLQYVQDIENALKKNQITTRFGHS